MASSLNRSRELYQARIEQTVTFISQNLDHPLDLKQVAQVSHFSPYHFHRIFTAVIGETPQDFVNRVRLEKAANMLQKSPALTITSETKMVGLSFDDPLITPKNKCRYYACVTVPDELTHDPRVGFLDIPATKCAVYWLTCRAEQIEPAYHIFYRDWLPDSGFQPADYPCYELYYETPEMNVEGKFVLEICIPVMPL